MEAPLAPEPKYDYVIVGSGAGGGTLAARLAENGMRVCLLEAGGDALDDPPGRAPGMPEDYLVPGFHPLASENPAMSWDFSVRHYADDKRQQADWKCEPDPITGEPGIFYPRAATLGGCTAHNAMIFIAPYESDWDEIARITGDDSWSARNMRRYLQRIESARYRPVWRFLNRFRHDELGNKWIPWLSTELALPRKAVRDDRLMKFIIESLSFVARSNRRERMAAYLKPPWLNTGWEWLESAWKAVRFGWRSAVEKSPLRVLIPGVLEGVNPNSQRRLRGRAEGPCFMPLSTHFGQRVGARERVKKVKKSHPKLLQIEYNALATKVILDAEKRAIGVEYLKGERLYCAHDNPSAEGEHREIRAAREVILAGGAFNTPQLLMLSGIGPKEVLEKHRIKVVNELEGVGQNLQDRYEVSVVHRMDKPWESLKGAEFKRGDRLYQQWLGRPFRRFLPEGWQKTRRRGIYTSNGAAIAFTRRSPAGLPDPDLFCMALLAKFRGYRRRYSTEDVCNPKHLDYLTWAILKAYTGSRGFVTLCSPNPQDRPRINFRYFDETDAGDAKKDVEAVVESIEFVRKIATRLKSQGLITGEEFPGEGPGFPGEGPEAEEELARHVRNTAWGHHASCTCPIGPPEPSEDLPKGGVLSSDFKVHGTQGLRVVDASVFPRIPGLFIVSAIYMIAEKAADVILKEANREGSGA